MTRTIFFISDGTGITAETLGHSLMTQFGDIDLRQIRIPFVDNKEKARAARERIESAAVGDGERPIVMNTVVDPDLCEILDSDKALMLDVFNAFLGQLEEEFDRKRSNAVGQAHGMVDPKIYESRMEATNFALTHDDGASINFRNADVILVGVSRSGKTPTCLYMALQFGVRAANYPLTEEDLAKMELPKFLRPLRDKLHGLTIDPDRLHQIRSERRPGSQYASLKQCHREVADAEYLFERYRIPHVATTHASIEEIASKVMQTLNLQKGMF